MKININKNILHANQQVANKNRELFNRHNLLVLNLMSSPGAGKTTLLERILPAFEGELSVGVIQGDIQTSLDTERVKRAGATFAYQINTWGACHIDGNMVASALEQIDLCGIDLLFVENVGNLVCPAEFDVGEDLKLMLFSVTEGEDKPKKYPLMFQESKLLLVNKIDLLEHLEVSIEKIHSSATEVHPGITILDISCKTGQGIDKFCVWVRQKVFEKRNQMETVSSV